MPERPAWDNGDGMMDSSEMVAMMNDTALLMSSSTGGTLSKTGSGRDADGTIDRSPPPTEEVKKILFELKKSIDEYGIDMILEFRTQGGEPVRHHHQVAVQFDHYHDLWP